MTAHIAIVVVFSLGYNCTGLQNNSVMIPPTIAASSKPLSQICTIQQGDTIHEAHIRQNFAKCFDIKPIIFYAI